MMIIETCVNTPDDVLFGNVAVNSRRELPWVQSVNAHDGQAVIVGGGPSVADWLEEIRWRKSIGQTVFALNNAAKTLDENGIRPDYQVVLDARAHNIAFVGHADHFLFASQCHPSLFDSVPNVTLWHQHYPDNMMEFEAALPSNHPAHALVGGGTTVGLSAMALAYILGYRKLHLYGYDSSHKDGHSHAYEQNDPQSVLCDVTCAGRKFKATLAMAQQAELFPVLSDKLIDLGCLITLRGDGLLPWQSKMSAIPSGMADDEKYRRMWEIDKYREFAPGLECADEFVDIAKVNEKTKVIDFGCGSGAGAKRIHELTNCPIHLVDFANNCRNDDVKLPFTVADLKYPIYIKGDIGYCTDVMEHIAEYDVKSVIRNIMFCVNRCFFQISLVADNFGTVIGEKLHLTVRPVEWWASLFDEMGYKVILQRSDEIAAKFYISTT